MSSDRPHTSSGAPPNHGAVDQDEIDRFDRIAAEWWDPAGKFRPLHAMNPTRAAYVCDRFAPLSSERPDHEVAQPLSGLRLLDVGCGGGLLAERLARWGAEVVAIDAGAEAIAVARRHAADQGLSIDYRCMTADVLAEMGGGFDGVTALEVIEHVPDPARFCRELASLVRPGGRVVMSTLNRTRTSFLTAIVGAEYALGWLPRGTHDWNRFLKPSELAAMLRRSGLVVEDSVGLRPDTPTGRQWRLSRSSMSVNYLIAAARPD